MPKRVADEDRLTVTRYAYLTPSEAEWLRQEARRRDMSESALIRELTMKLVAETEAEMRAAGCL
jgi:hypothetical protein